MADFVDRVRKWNVEVFGNIFAKKRKVLARLNGTQKAIAENPNDFLLNLENQLLSEYSLILMQEEEFWALKSRLNETTFGDRNTSFFHVSTVVRRHRNKIRCIKDAVRNCLTKDNEVKEHIRSGFINLYTTELRWSTKSSNVSNFSCCYLSNEDRARIDYDVTVEEIRAGLWAFKPFKALGPDGLHAGFYQHFWMEVKNSVCEEIKGIFMHGIVPRYLNEKLISLIPKCQNP